MAKLAFLECGSESNSSPSGTASALFPDAIEREDGGVTTHPAGRVPHVLEISPSHVTHLVHHQTLDIAGFSSSPAVIYCKEQDLTTTAVFNPELSGCAVIVNLRPARPRLERCDGYASRLPEARPGAYRVYDLRHKWAIEVPHELLDLVFVLPPALIPVDKAANLLLAPTGASRCSTLHRVDPVVAQLVQTLSPLSIGVVGAEALFADHVISAIAVRVRRLLLHDDPIQPKENVLAPWQERRAIDYMLERLAENVELSDIAAVCGLSKQHFGRLFRATTGMSPFQWLKIQRVERASALLKTTDATLSDIAEQCGFANQSHFTRVFGQVTGTSPGLWRLRVSEELRTGDQGIDNRG